ncbi:MAG TPA: hypothetical protein VGL13_15215 [Polyangiaceae bacterium]|jgi:hypothetical protein
MRKASFPLARSSVLLRFTLSAAAALFIILALPRAARADEQSIIKLPGEHPRYTFEIEPQLLLGWNELKDGPGVGGRIIFPIISNGFVSSINNSVGIGFGFDVDPLRTANHFILPVVLQWNFWLSTHWSVFGEPGLAITFDNGDGKFGPVFYAGGRYHVTKEIALTLRLGVPGLDAAVGISFLL